MKVPSKVVLVDRALQWLPITGDPLMGAHNAD